MKGVHTKPNHLIVPERLFFKLSMFKEVIEADNQQARHVVPCSGQAINSLHIQKNVYLQLFPLNNHFPLKSPCKG